MIDLIGFPSGKYPLDSERIEGRQHIALVLHAWVDIVYMRDVVLNGRRTLLLCGQGQSFNRACSVTRQSRVARWIGLINSSYSWRERRNKSGRWNRLLLISLDDWEVGLIVYAPFDNLILLFEFLTSLKSMQVSLELTFGGLVTVVEVTNLRVEVRNKISQTD